MPRLTTQDFINQSLNIHQGIYDYSKVEYHNGELLVIIICKEHGEFKQKPNTHKQGKGCPKCGVNRQRLITSKSNDDFIKDSIRIHGYVYNYDKTQYINSKTNVLIGCATHGLFTQKPERHLEGRGCPKCRGKKLSLSKRDTVEDFIKKAKQIHGDTYGYSNVIYKNAHTKVDITCPIHGIFSQKPNNHVFNKCGCPACGSNNISREGSAWLDSLNVTCREYRIPLTPYIVDGYDPHTNTVYEYMGSFWHGHPKLFNQNDINPKTKTTYGELYQRTVNKIDHLKQLGYQVVVKWDKD